MIITDLSYFEWDFCEESTKNTGATKVRSLDIDKEYSLFIYHFTDYVHLAITRYDERPINKAIWERLSDIEMIYPNLPLFMPDDIWINQEKQQLHVKLGGVISWPKED